MPFGLFNISPLSHKTSTPAERSVAVWLLIAILAGLSVVCLYFAFNAAPGKEAVAGELYEYAAWFGGAAAGVWLLYRLALWLLDR